MRSIRYNRARKINRRPKVNKKRKNKPKHRLGPINGNSNFDFENLNEVLREHKRQRTEGRGSWKVVPKDSCEVYKRRQKRETGKERQKNNDSSYTPTEESEVESEGNKSDVSGNKKQAYRKVKKQKRKQQIVKKISKKTRQKPKKYRRTRNSNESNYSYSSTSITLCTSCSDIE